jgi:hypothetical protein
MFRCFDCVQFQVFDDVLLTERSPVPFNVTDLNGIDQRLTGPAMKTGQ